MKNYLVTLASGEEIIVEANSVNECGDRVIDQIGCAIDDFEINCQISDYEAEILGLDTY